MILKLVWCLNTPLFVLQIKTQCLLQNCCYVLPKYIYKFFLKICPQSQRLVSGELDRTLKRNTLKWMIKVISCKCMSVVSVKIAPPPPTILFPS